MQSPDPKASLGPLLDLVARRIRAEVDAELSRFGLRPLHLVTMTVLELSGEHGQSDLAEYLRIDRNTMVSLLNELKPRASSRGAAFDRTAAVTRCR